MTYKRIAALSILIAHCLIIAQAGMSDDNTHETPVFFSYAWPIGPDTPRDFRQIDMHEITVIDVGPDSVSYPPSIRNTYPSDIYPLWHDNGKILVRRCYDRPFGSDNKKIPLDEVTVDQLVQRWSHSLEEPGIDGISIDEFIKKDDHIVDVWIDALKLVRERYPDKLIFCWIAGKGLQFPRLHRAIRDFADYCMPEIYYRESAAEGYPDFTFSRFREAVDILETNAPGIAGKTLMGLGVNERLFDDTQTIDFGEFIEAQIRCIRTDPVLKQLPGLALYTPARMSQDGIEQLDSLLMKYYQQ